MAADDLDRQLDACRRHTTFYQHSLGQYACHFAGREPVYVSVEAPPQSAEGGFAAVRRALGVAADVVAGDPVTLTPDGLDPVEGVVRLRRRHLPRRPHVRRAAAGATAATPGAGR